MMKKGKYAKLIPHPESFYKKNWWLIFNILISRALFYWSVIFQKGKGCVLGVSDSKLSAGINDACNIKCSHIGIHEVIRGIRQHFPKLVKGFSSVTSNSAQLRLAHSFSKFSLNSRPSDTTSSSPTTLNSRPSGIISKLPPNLPTSLRELLLIVAETGFFPSNQTHTDEIETGFSAVTSDNAQLGLSDSNSIQTPTDIEIVPPTENFTTDFSVVNTANSQMASSDYLGNP